MDHSGVLHDGSAGSHATASSAAGTGAADAATTNFRQIGTRRGNGRLLLGAAHSYHASSVAAAAAGGVSTGDASAALLQGSVPSIPSRFETVLYAGDQEPDAFASRVARFKSTHVDVPGPGTYAGDVVSPLSSGGGSSLKLSSESWSSKGLGVGFVSKAARFKRKGGGVGPGQYDPASNQTLMARTSSAPARGSQLPAGTAAFRPAMNAALNPELAGSVKNNLPGPGYYRASSPAKSVVLSGMEQRKIANKAQRAQTASRMGTAAAAPQSAAAFPPSYTPFSPGATATLASSLQAALSPEPAFQTRDARFRTHSGAGGLGATATGCNPRVAPGAYTPNYDAVLKASPGKHAAAQSVFRSQTLRTDFTQSSTEVPGVGTYTKEIAPSPAAAAAAAEEKDASASAGSFSLHSPTRSFHPSSLDRFGRSLDPRVAPDNFPGVGSYDPIVPGAGPLARAAARAESPDRRGRAATALGISSPLVASQSHGLPLRAAQAGPAPLGPDGQPLPVKRKKRAAGMGGPGRSLLATRGGPGVALNAPAMLLRPPPPPGTFGRAGSHASGADLTPDAPRVVKDSEIRPPGPSFYDTTTAFHETHDKRAFHLNTAHRWM